MHNSSVREEAMKLRLKGRSYNEIASTLEVAKSTLHSWLAGVQLSRAAQQRISERVHEGSVKGLIKHNKLQTHAARKRAVENKNKGKKMLPELKKSELLLLGAALYWGEGYKKELIKNGRRLTHHPVSLSNSDPEIIRVFLRFLRECFGVKDEDIQVDVRIYEHMNEEELIRFWQSVVKLPRKNFTKVYYGVSISSKRKRAYNRLPYGTAQVRVNSTPLYHHIMGLIEGIISKT